MNELEKCPFCGSAAEFGRRVMPKETRRFGDEKSRAAFLENAEFEFASGPHLYMKSEISKAGTHPGKGWFKTKGDYIVTYEINGYIPKCSRTDCICRTSRIFRTRKEAVATWNHRTRD